MSSARARIAWVLLLLPAAASAGDTLLARWDAPPKVTLKASKIRVEEAVERICKATGQKVSVGANGRQVIEIDLKDATFFQAIDEVAQRAGLIVTGTPGNGDEGSGEGGASLRLDRMPAEMKRLAPVVSGPVRISVVGMFAQRSAARLFSPEAAQPDDAPRQLWVEMRVLVEAGFDDVALKELRVESAPDDSERNLAGTKSIVRDGAPGQNLRVELEAAGSSALMVRNLNGRAVFLVPEEIALLKFTAASRNVSKKLGDAKFVFKRIDRKGEDGEPEMVVLLDGVPCAEVAGENRSAWERVRVATSSWGGPRYEDAVVRIFLYDRSDNPIGASTSFSSTSDDERECRFTLDELPARIEVRAVTKVQKREVAFRFADLPIPR